MINIAQKRSEQTVSIQLSVSLYTIAEEAVSLGLSDSPEAFIAESIRRRAREVHLTRLDKMAEEAMNDPAFVVDMRETMQAFESVDTEHWPPPIESGNTLSRIQEDQAA